ncbi:uncharacterized protein LOC132577929 [Heteronotia binoei]|uniref:uncharacterized protein LOC132577929 n=1 Tax=Heteronotia binoei TaxID=13085 RepID=UPI0029301C44|nr:uncharacterized protein LOC132577929 [Heteronotia binoei]
MMVASLRAGLPLVITANPTAGVMPKAAHEQRGRRTSYFLPFLFLLLARRSIGFPPATQQPTSSHSPAAPPREQGSSSRSENEGTSLPPNALAGRHTASRLHTWEMERRKAGCCDFLFQPSQESAVWRAGGAVAPGLVRCYVQSTHAPSRGLQLLVLRSGAWRRFPPFAKDHLLPPPTLQSPLPAVCLGKGMAVVGISAKANEWCYMSWDRLESPTTGQDPTAHQTMNLLLQTVSNGINLQS